MMGVAWFPLGMRERLEAEQRRLMDHPIYRGITEDGLPHFMEHHVFAVLDFMWLLKVLQRRLTSVADVWTPNGDPSVRRLINEIVLGEESDEIDGVVLSHFEMYLDAMREAGADTGPVLRFVEEVERRVPVTDALARCGAPPAAARFTSETWALVNEGTLAQQAGVFAFGREQIIPEMFAALVGQRAIGRYPTFRLYLDRHIEVDGDNHGPMALRMVSAICGPRADEWRQVEEASLRSLAARRRLWDAAMEGLPGRSPAPVARPRSAPGWPARYREWQAQQKTNGHKAAAVAPGWPARFASGRPSRAPTGTRRRSGGRGRRPVGRPASGSGRRPRRRTGPPERGSSDARLRPERADDPAAGERPRGPARAAWCAGARSTAPDGSASTPWSPASRTPPLTTRSARGAGWGRGWPGGSSWTSCGRRRSARRWN